MRVTAPPALHLLATMTEQLEPRRPSADDLDRVLRENLPALHAFVRARLGPGLAAHESTSDVVQSVCRELIVGHRELHDCGDAGVRSWLFTAALRKIWQHDRHRRAKKRAAPPPPGALTEDRARASLDGHAHLATPSCEVSAREQLTRLEQALSDLDEGDRELIALHKVAGLAHAEIAVRIGKSEAACRQGLRRALVRLAARLERLGVGDGPARDA